MQERHGIFMGKYTRSKTEIPIGKGEYHNSLNGAELALVK